MSNTPRLRPCPRCGKTFDSKKRYRICTECRLPGYKSPGENFFGKVPWTPVYVPLPPKIRYDSTLATQAATPRCTISGCSWRWEKGYDRLCPGHEQALASDIEATWAANPPLSWKDVPTWQVDKFLAYVRTPEYQKHLNEYQDKKTMQRIKRGLILSTLTQK